MRWHNTPQLGKRPNCDTHPTPTVGFGHHDVKEIAYEIGNLSINKKDYLPCTKFVPANQCKCGVYTRNQKCLGKDHQSSEKNKICRYCQSMSREKNLLCRNFTLVSLKRKLMDSNGTVRCNHHLTQMCSLHPARGVTYSTGSRWIY
jgi:hypothetical protein